MLKKSQINEYSEEKTDCIWGCEALLHTTSAGLRPTRKMLGIIYNLEIYPFI